MLKKILLVTICLFLLFSIPKLFAQADKPTDTEETTAAPEKVTLDDVTKKQNDMFLLVDQYNELVKLAKEADSYERKKDYMEQAKEMEGKINEIQKDYSATIKQYNKQVEDAKKIKSDPEADRLFRALKSVEEQINKKTTEHNDLLPKLQKAQEEGNNLEARNLTDKIEDIRTELKRLKKELNEKLSEYKEMTKEKEQKTK